MRTWSLESLICSPVRFAKAVVAPLFVGCEGADELAEREAEVRPSADEDRERIGEVGDFVPLPLPRDTSCACCGKMDYCPDGFCQKCSRCAQCQRHLGDGAAVNIGSKRRFCLECYESIFSTTAAGEPQLTDDELVAVRGLIQERYDDSADHGGAWTFDGRCVYCGGTREYIVETGPCVGPWCPHKSSFAGAAASLAGASPGTPASEDTLRDNPLPGLDPVAPHKTSAHPPAPDSPGGRTPTASARRGSPSNPGGELDPDLDPSPPGPDLATWLEPAVMTVLDKHMSFTGGKPFVNRCDCGHKADDYRGWLEHVTPILTKHIAQALPDYPPDSANQRAKRYAEVLYEHFPESSGDFIVCCDGLNFDRVFEWARHVADELNPTVTNNPERP